MKDTHVLARSNSGLNDGRAAPTRRRRTPLVIALLLAASTAYGDFDCPSNVLVNPAFDTGSFAPWTSNGWVFGGPQMSPPGSVFFGGTTPATNSLTQVLATPTKAKCVRYHVTLEDLSLAGIASWQFTVNYTVGPPDVSTFLHPGGNEAGHPANYRSVNPVFDSNRFITSITVEQSGAFNGSPTCVDNFMVCPDDFCPGFQPPCNNDGIVDVTEQCDDGNLIDGDGCDSNCTLTGCGNGIPTAGEQCDDGNFTNGDGCDATCHVEGCGNGLLDLGEDCDLSSPMGAFCPPPQVCDPNCNCVEVVTTTTPTTSSSTTTTTQPDHFQCYEVKPAEFANRTITAQDQFGTLSLSIRFPTRLCAPADKNGEGIPDPTEHLAGYKAKGTFTKRLNQTVVNQFGMLQLDVVRPDMFMIPTSKDGVPIALPVGDHFTCYKVRRSRGATKFVPQTVTVSDQFQDVSETLLKPVRLCAPANKNGEDPTAPSHANHILCYKTKSPGTLGTIVKSINNQLGPAEVKLIARRELCVPSLKNPGATTTSTVPVTTTSSSTEPVTTTTSEPTTTTSTTLIGSPSGAFVSPAAR